MLALLKKTWAAGSPPWEEQGRIWSEHQGVLPSKKLRKKQFAPKTSWTYSWDNFTIVINIKSPCHPLHYKSESEASIGSSSSDLWICGLFERKKDTYRPESHMSHQKELYWASQHQMQMIQALDKATYFRIDWTIRRISNWSNLKLLKSIEKHRFNACED